MNAPASSTSQAGAISRGESARYQLFAVAGVAAFVTGVLVAFMLYFQRSQDVDAGKKLTESFAQVIEEQTTRTLQTIDLRLQLMITGLAALEKSNEPRFSIRLFVAR